MPAMPPPHEIGPSVDAAVMTGAYRASSSWSAAGAILVTLAIIVASIGAGGLASVFSPAALTRVTGKSAIAFMALSQIIMIALTLLAARRGSVGWRDAFALNAPPRGFVDYAWTLAVMLVVLAIVNAVAVTRFGHDPLADLKSFATIFQGDLWFLALIVVGIGAPVSEELLFRGFLQSALTRSKLGFAGGAIIATIIWAALHAGYTVVGLIEVALIGGIFSYALWRTGSLRVTLACHALYNSALALFVRFLLPA